MKERESAVKAASKRAAITGHQERTGYGQLFCHDCMEFFTVLLLDCDDGSARHSCGALCKGMVIEVCHPPFSESSGEDILPPLHDNYDAPLVYSECSNCEDWKHVEDAVTGEVLPCRQCADNED